jgi:TPR repeat protein
MGDYYWYGCGHDQHIEKASNYYTQAAVKGDPHVSLLVLHTGCCKGSEDLPLQQPVCSTGKLT